VALLRSMARSLVLEGKIDTTVAKAKFVQRFVERLITLGKKKDRQSARVMRLRLPNEAALERIQEDLAKRFSNREGGYTRLYRIGYRQGDGAEMARVSLIEK
jgi:large subunit ribosomal protein L17